MKTLCSRSRRGSGTWAVVDTARVSHVRKIKKGEILMLYEEFCGESSPRWLKISEAAGKLNVSESTIRRLLAGGDLEATKVRGAVRVDGDDLDRYLKARRYADLRSSGMLARIRGRLLARQAARARQQ